MSFLVHPFRPSFEFDLRKARELFHFGKWIFGVSVLTFLGTQLDTLIVGRYLGAAGLGVYAIAKRLSLYLPNMLVPAISPVSFSAFSRLQDHHTRQRSALNTQKRCVPPVPSVVSS